MWPDKVTLKTVQWTCRPELKGNASLPNLADLPASLPSRSQHASTPFSPVDWANESLSSEKWWGISSNHLIGKLDTVVFWKCNFVQIGDSRGLLLKECFGQRLQEVRSGKKSLFRVGAFKSELHGNFRSLGFTLGLNHQDVPTLSSGPKTPRRLGAVTLWTFFPRCCLPPVSCLRCHQNALERGMVTPVRAWS